MATINTDTGRIKLIRNCPFCNGKAEIKPCRIYLDEGVKITCSECHASSKPILINHPKAVYNGLDESTRYTREQAIEKALDLWNRRINNA